MAGHDSSSYFEEHPYMQTITAITVKAALSPVYQPHWAGDGQTSDRPLQHQVILSVLDERLAHWVGPLPAPKEATDTQRVFSCKGRSLRITDRHRCRPFASCLVAQAIYLVLPVPSRRKWQLGFEQNQQSAKRREKASRD